MGYEYLSHRLPGIIAFYILYTVIEMRKVLSLGRVCCAVCAVLPALFARRLCCAVPCFSSAAVAIDDYYRLLMTINDY